MMSIWLRLNVFPFGAFRNELTRQVPSKRLAEPDSAAWRDLCLVCAGSDGEAAGGGLGGCSLIGAGQRCAEKIIRAENTADARFISVIKSKPALAGQSPRHSAGGG